MAFCVKCGAYIAEGSNTCPACGKKVGEPEKKKTKTSASTSAGAAAQAAEEPKKTKQQSQTRKKAQSGERPRQENRSSTQTDTSGTYTYNSNTQSGNDRSTASGSQSGEYHYSYKQNYNNNTGTDTNEVWEDAKKAWEDTKKTWGGVKRKWTRKVKDQYNNNYNNNYGYDYSTNRRGVNGVYSVSDQESRPMIAILSYFGLLFLVPYILRNDSEFVRFHANQGLLLFLCSAASSVAAGMPFLGWLCGAVGWVFTIVCFFQGINNVIKGRFRELPIIGKIRLLK